MLRKQLRQQRLGHTRGNHSLFLDKNKLSGDWTGALCGHGLHLQTSVAGSQLLGDRPRGDPTYLPPPVGLPSGTSPGATGLLRSGPGKVAAEILCCFGLVLVNTGDLSPLGPTTATHRALEGEEERRAGTERKVGHINLPIRDEMVKCPWQY